MTLWIFDTDHATLFGQGNPQIVQRVSAVNPKDIAITIVTFEEQMYGRLNRIRRAKSEDEVISAYASLRKTINYLTDFELLDFDRDAQHYYMEFLRQKIRVGTQDLRIAAIALSKSGILLIPFFCEAAYNNSFAREGFRLIILCSDLQNWYYPEWPRF